jgi:hypothetical protein
MTALNKYLKHGSVFIAILSMLLAPVVLSGASYAATTCQTGNESGCTSTSGSCGSSNGLGNCADPASTSKATCTASNCDLIKKYINPLISLLSALVGVAVTISIIIGGIQYSSSNGNAQQITAAKARIRNSLIALLAFFFLYTFLQFLVPGGIFRK